MEDETGKKSAVESDVKPVLKRLTSDDVAGFERRRLTRKSFRDLRKDDEEDLFSDDDTVINFIDEPPTTEAVEETEPNEEGEAEQVVEQEPQETPLEQADTSQSKKARVQVDPNASIKDTSEESHFLTALPVVPESDTSYVPILYTFRVKIKCKATKLKHIKTKPPPFYLQFDHCIAVIWTLFSKEASKENLGIAQLQWALHFLQSLYNSEGVHPRDVQLCIDTIQNYLIDKYAEMSGEAVVYQTEKPTSLEEPQTEKAFSLNYSQMLAKVPEVGIEAKESQVLDKQILEDFENVKNVVGIESVDLSKVVSKDQLMDILNDWKKEQIEKIQEELKMLFVVEDMLKNSDSQNFEGYTDEAQFHNVFKRN